MATNRAIRETIPAAEKPMAYIPIPRKKVCMTAVPSTPCTTLRIVALPRAANCSPPSPASVLKIDFAAFSADSVFTKSAPDMINEIINSNNVPPKPAIAESTLGASSLS